MSDIKTFSEVIQNAITSNLVDVHTSLPGRVEKYYKDGNKADVTILLKRKVAGNLIEYPKLTDVPIGTLQSNGGKSFISMPLKKGDTGIITFMERSIDKWLVNGQLTDPEDARKFDLSDAVFTPDLSDFSKSIERSTTDGMELQNDKSQLILYPDGKIEIKGNNVDLISIVSDVIDNLIGATTNTAIGPMPFFVDTIVNFTKNKAEISQLKK